MGCFNTLGGPIHVSESPGSGEKPRLSEADHRRCRQVASARNEGMLSADTPEVLPLGRLWSIVPIGSTTRGDLQDAVTVEVLHTDC